MPNGPTFGPPYSNNSSSVEFYSAQDLLAEEVEIKKHPYDESVVDAAYSGLKTIVETLPHTDRKDAVIEMIDDGDIESALEEYSNRLLQ